MSRSSSPATAIRSTSPTCSRRPTASTATCSTSGRRRRSAGSPRTTVPTGMTPSVTATTCRADSPTRTPQHADELHRWPIRRRPVPRACHPRDRGFARVQGWRPDRRHIREAFPPFTYTGNSFANSKRQAPNYSSSLISDSAGETLFGQGVDYEPTGPNTPLQTDAQGNQLYPARVTTPTLTARPIASPRPFRLSRPERVYWAAAAPRPGRARTRAPRRRPARA